VTEIQQNRWDQLIRRVANIVGGGSQVNDTLNELFPTLDVENVPSELLALSRTSLVTAGSLLNPSVGNVNKHQLFNPATSSVMLVVTQMIVSTGVAGNSEIVVEVTARTTNVGNVQRRDTRAGFAEAVIGENRTQQDAAGVASIVNIRLLANTAFSLTDPNDLFVLFPGTGVTFSPTTANVQSVCQFFWRERVFEPAEINF